MSDLAMQLASAAGANAVVATLLALVAWWLNRRGQHRVAHVLCVVALLKLVTPPLVHLPVVPTTEPVVLTREQLVRAAMTELEGETSSAPAKNRLVAGIVDFVMGSNT